MKVFISWSGDLSRQLGEAVRNWLPSALQYVKPYFTPDDIDKGAKWASEVFKELSASSVCIIILTRDNLASSWIMFEAGAISSTLDNARVCPIIFDLEPTDLQGPLAQFQITRFLKADIRKLFNTINSLAGDNKLNDSVVESVFDKWWPDLESALKNILEGHTANSNVKKIRSDRELIEEILLLTRKDKEPSPRPSAPYEGSPIEASMKAIKWVIDEDGWITLENLHSRLLDIQSATQKRIAEGPSKMALLNELAEMLALTKPKPKPASRGKRVISSKDDDDDIPF